MSEDLRKRLAELREMATEKLNKPDCWCSECRLNRALLALLPVVEAMASGTTWEQLWDLMEECERALTQQEPAQ